MNKLWAPWRISYITGKKQKGCIFCKAVNSKVNKDLVIAKSQFSIAMLNKYPYNNGHIMISPKRHVSQIEKLTKEEIADIFSLLNKCKNKLDKKLHPHGYNIGINIGRDAGAGITGHLHVHLVPRYRGDVNFMPSVSGVKVISQSLEDLAKLMED
jgi:ATP adenylyltransferase